MIELANVDVASPVEDGRRVLEGVDWRVAAGNYWVIKSGLEEGADALFLTAAGALRPASGVVRLFGRDTSPFNPEDLLEQRLRISLVLSGGGRLFPELTVAENVALPYCYHRNCELCAAGEWFEKLLAFAGLEEWAERLPSELPRAIVLNVGLARGLCLKPEVLLLEHPAFGLELGQRRWLLEKLGQLSSGHPILNGRPLTIAVTTTEFQPWLGYGRQFGVIEGKRLRILAGEADARAADDAAGTQLIGRKVDLSER